MNTPSDIWTLSVIYEHSQWYMNTPSDIWTLSVIYERSQWYMNTPISTVQMMIIKRAGAANQITQQWFYRATKKWHSMDTWQQLAKVCIEALWGLAVLVKFPCSLFGKRWTYKSVSEWLKGWLIRTCRVGSVGYAKATSLSSTVPSQCLGANPPL